MIKIKPIKIPKGVEVNLKEETIEISGEKGKIERKIPQILDIKKEKDEIKLSLKKGYIRFFKKAKALLGTYQRILENDIFGVKEGYEKKLEIKGIGYKASLDDEGNLLLYLGFTHPKMVKKEEGISIKVEKNIITVFGAQKDKVFNFAAKIRKVKAPEPYKGKGIRYLGEEVRKKIPKKALATGISEK